MITKAIIITIVIATLCQAFYVPDTLCRLTHFIPIVTPIIMNFFFSILRMRKHSHRVLVIFPSSNQVRNEIQPQRGQIPKLFSVRHRGKTKDHQDGRVTGNRPVEQDLLSSCCASLSGNSGGGLWRGQEGHLGDQSGSQVRQQFCIMETAQLLADGTRVPGHLLVAQPYESHLISTNHRFLSLKWREHPVTMLTGSFKVVCVNVYQIGCSVTIQAGPSGGLTWNQTCVLWDIVDTQ